MYEPQDKIDVKKTAANKKVRTDAINEQKLFSRNVYRRRETFLLDKHFKNASGLCVLSPFEVPSP